MNIAASSKIIMLLLLTLASSNIFAAKTNADEEKAVRAAIAKMVPNPSIGGVTPSAVGGFYEVILDGQIVYVSADGKHLFSGNLWNIENKKNLTETRFADVRRASLAAVPPEKRIIFPAKSPQYTVTVFTDIDCGYCRRLHQQIGEYNDSGISVEYLFFPRAGRGSEAWEKAEQVWCSTNKQEAFTKAKAGQALEAKSTCDNPVEENYELGQKLGISGTPAIFAQNGAQLGGYLTTAQMVERLKQLDK